MSAVTKHTNLGYRRDIDGLRCLAVMAVVLFHAPLGAFSGGYVGVDIFFVISGYLLGRIVWSELAAGRFSVAAFYERRARRILPAVLVTILLTNVAALAFLFPRELQAFGQSVIAAVLFVSNLFFSESTDYFAGRPASSLLLHLWSLGVEEQFYLAFPLCCILLRRFLRGAPALGLAGLLLVSFSANLMATTWAPRFAFYAMPTRAWELLLGALLSLGAVPPLRRRILREGFAALGLALIVISLHGFRRQTPFPGVAAVVPCLGAALIIYSGDGGRTLVSAGLSLRPLVFVGTISYSIYLWHWPLFVYFGLRYRTFPTRWEKLALVAAAVALGALSWWLIEQPFRTRRVAASRAAIVRHAVALSLVLLTSGAVVAMTDGLPGRYGEAVTRMAAYLDYRSAAVYREGTCFVSAGTRLMRHYRAEVCSRISAEKSNYLLIGDSHAAQYWKGLAQTYPRTNFLQATAAGCKPLLGERAGAPPCVEFMWTLLHDFVATRQLDGIVLAARWHSGDRRPLLETVAHLERHVPNIVVIGPIAEYQIALPRLLAIAEARADNAVVERARAHEVGALDQSLAQAVSATQARYLSPYQTMCTPARCVTRASNGAPMQFDYGHLTEEGATWLATEWQEQGFHFDRSIAPASAPFSGRRASH